MRPYRRIQIGLVVLGLAVAMAGIGGSAVLARNVTAPVAKLVEGTRQVAAGNFDYQLDVRSGDEIGDLARSFNVMIQGLRERVDMQKFVSLSTVEMIQSPRKNGASAGERVLRTIFFSDIRSFTDLSERMPPEDVVSILNHCLHLQAKQVQRFGGDIDKYVGDSVVALFQSEDMELRAIRCAVEIQKGMEAENAARAFPVPIRLGVGISTGEVILGSIGSEHRLDFTVIGSHVNLAARLCSIAKPNEILLTESTYRSVRDLIQAERIESVKVKGFAEPIPIYRMAVSRESA